MLKLSEIYSKLCWRLLRVLCSDLDLLEFSEPGVSNYTTLLLNEKRNALYVGALEAVFELSKKNVTVRNNKVASGENKKRPVTKDIWTIKKLF